MAVGQQNAVDLVFSLEQPGEVRNDDVNAEHVGLRKHDATVNEHNAAIDFNGGAVSTDLSETSQKHHTNV